MSLPVRPYSIEELDECKRQVQEQEKEQIPRLLVGYDEPTDGQWPARLFTKF